METTRLRKEMQMWAFDHNHSVHNRLLEVLPQSHNEDSA